MQNGQKMIEKTNIKSLIKATRKPQKALHFSKIMKLIGQKHYKV